MSGMGFVGHARCQRISRMKKKADGQEHQAGQGVLEPDDLVVRRNNAHGSGEILYCVT
jgi:hypothetical protein